MQGRYALRDDMQEKTSSLRTRGGFVGGVETTVQAIATGVGDMAFPIDFSM